MNNMAFEENIVAKLNANGYMCFKRFDPSNSSRFLTIQANLRSKEVNMIAKIDESGSLLIEQADIIAYGEYGELSSSEILEWESILNEIIREETVCIS